MSWDALARFIQLRDPEFAASLEGVPAHELQRFERENGIRLPAMYRGFLETMGRGNGGFHLFGPGHEQDFDALCAELPAETYPGTRYVRIAFPNDDAEFGAHDHFIDVSRSDGEDAPLVMFEETPEFMPENVVERRFTFGEWATRQVFRFLVTGRAAARVLVVVGHVRPEDGKASAKELVELLVDMGFQPALPPRDRVVCLLRAQYGALVDVLAEGRGVSVTLSGDDRAGLEAVVDQMQVRYPGATVTDPDRPGGM